MIFKSSPDISTNILFVILSSSQNRGTKFWKRWDHGAQIFWWSKRPLPCKRRCNLLMSTLPQARFAFFPPPLPAIAIGKILRRRETCFSNILRNPPSRIRSTPPLPKEAPMSQALFDKEGQGWFYNSFWFLTPFISCIISWNKKHSFSSLLYDFGE